MRRIHLDAVGGIAGDMFVAAMLDAFPALTERVLADGRAVLPPEAGGIGLKEGESGSIRALRFGLDAGASPPGGAQPAPASPSRFPDLVARIGAAPLSDGTADAAVAILTTLATAEASIHRVALADVHFHELADWDSLLDVVCAGSIAAALAGTVWSVSPLPRGGGLVRTAHGMLPVPAPATVEILRGFRWRDDGIGGERVTPTGAAILRHLIIPSTVEAHGRLTAAGTGAGTRNLANMPNVLRALVFESDDEDAPAHRVGVVEFEVDDMTGEEIGVAADRLRGKPGVLDIVVTSVHGKKGRPAVSLRLLTVPDHLDAVARQCFEETTTIGLRYRQEARMVLRREAIMAAGLPVKVVERPGGTTRKAESDALTGESLAERRRARQRAEESTDD